MTDDERKKAKIRALNDALRMHFQGGSVVLTRGIASLDEEHRSAILNAVRTFDNWSEDVDPHQEHDFVAVEVTGQKVFAKIDYYDLAMQLLSPDPSDPTVTVRVLTIMLAREY